jgi:Na+/melibiose symporter-like transporter
MLAVIPLWSKAGKHVEPNKLLMLAFAGQIAQAPLVFLLPEGATATAFAFVLLRGLFAGVDFLLLRTMVADFARETAATGLRHGASCYSVSNITLKLGMGAGAWFALSAIGMASGEAMAGSGQESHLIRLVYATIPMLTGLAGLLIVATTVPGDRPARARRKLAPAADSRPLTAAPQIMP